MIAASVHLGFAAGSGEPVAVPVQHLAVTGQTQMSGKTTTLEALVARSGLKAIAFVTKRHEGSFRGEHHRIAPYFRERADWQFVSAVLEATLREKMRFERSWIMRACKGAKTLRDVQRNVQRLMYKAKGLSADVYMTLDHYLDIVVPQIERLDMSFGGDTLTLSTGLNVMDLSDYTAELQALVIRSVIEWVYEQASGVLVIIPEAWEFVPQNRGSPVLLACEQLIRKGGAGRNFVWLDSQDIAGVHKNVLRSVGVWILGVQREANEVKRALAHIPGKKPKLDDVMQLERGQFFVCFGHTVIKTYVQPVWMDEHMARAVACGASKMPEPPDRKEKAVDEKEAQQLRDDCAKLTARVVELEAALYEAHRSASAWQGGYTAQPSVDPNAPPPPPPHEEEYHIVQTFEKGPPPKSGRPELAPVKPPDIDALYQAIKARALVDDDPKLLALLKRVPEIEVTRTIERIRVDEKTQPGFLAGMIAGGFFSDPVDGAGVAAELKRRGRSVHNANVYRDLNRLAEQGFLTKESDGYRAVPGMTVNIIEEQEAA